MGLFFVLVAWQPKHTHPSKMRCECRQCRFARLGVRTRGRDD